MSKKHKGHHEEHVDESWLIPYADLLTLLLALFIVLFASSNVDSAKYRAVMEALSVAFNGPSPIPMEGLGIGGPEDGDVQPPPDLNLDQDEADIVQKGEDIKQLESLYNEISKYIEENNLENEIQLNTGLEGEKQGVLITLASDVWFDSGSAVITPKMQKVAEVLARMIMENQTKDHPFYVIVTGHTDNLPIHTAQYPSNWYLSVDRAVNFMGFLMEHAQLDPRLFSARGYGEYVPVGDNNTVEGRQKNRRVEVLISPTSAPSAPPQYTIEELEQQMHNPLPSQFNVPKTETPGETNITESDTGAGGAEPNGNAGVDANNGENPPANETGHSE